jgi:hypothetical protein
MVLVKNVDPHDLAVVTSFIEEHWYMFIDHVQEQHEMDADGASAICDALKEAAGVA